MAISVEIDRQSGFCGGVIRAISKAEEYLDKNPGKSLYSLGAIVHNEAELNRLGEKGLVAIDRSDMEDINGAEGETLLIRAHGEPPETYDTLKTLGFDVIDCTCPVVLKLQQNIREAYNRLHSDGKDGQVIIFGKIGHAEVLGLIGQVGGDALVVESKEMFLENVEAGNVKVDGPIEIFSQTTKSPSEYAEICSLLQGMAKDTLEIHNTICQQVATRHAELSEFAMTHDVIVFVSGRASSNGKVLCDLCKSVNIRTYHIGEVSELKNEWFRDDDRVGICGATSTPKWLLEEVAKKILQGIC
ncbi:MAG: 4-hydroxy-3-methylbut-2-enyl diphosphate reductase [Bacteroidales bacterium]|nr:4-hydroxy-3-methylbut-2-enyl diphosphate reductase [Bacteroidales bacterium]